MTDRVTDRLRAALVALALAAFAAPAPAGAQVESGPRIRGNFAELTLGGRVQTQFNTTTAEDEPASELILRRVRLEATVKINELVSGKIAPDFAGDRVSVKDAYLRLDLAPAFGLLAGKAYRPFGLLEQTSSTRILPIERGARIRGVQALDEYAVVNSLGYSDRDIGVQVVGAPEGAPLRLGYAVGVFRGPLGGAIGNDDSYQFAARATVAPLSDLRFGAGWSSRDFARRLAGDDFETDRGNAWEVDVEYGAFDPGFHLLGEFAFGDFDPFNQEGFVGAQAWLGYRTRPLGRIAAVEPILRLSYADVDRTVLDTPELGGTLITPGINLWLGGLNRLQLNYDFWEPNGGGDREGSLKAQFQMAF